MNPRAGEDKGLLDGLTTVWKVAGAENADLMAVQHYSFTILLIVLVFVLWLRYRRACDLLDRYQGKKK